MPIWDIKSAQGRYALFYLNSSRSTVAAYLSLVSGRCAATAESGLFLTATTYPRD